MDVNSKLQELKLTPEEMSRLSKAFKDEKFREMLREYAEEISHPENKKKYEEEITLMEQERGMDIKFVHPNPERVLKTSLDGKQKCFINICSNDLIGKPQSKPDRGVNGTFGQHWSLPYSVTPGRPDMDSKGNKYMLYDVVFHPDTLHIARKSDKFMKLVDSTAVQGIQDQFKAKLDEKNVKVLKMKYKGVPNPSVIRKPIHSHPGREKPVEPNDPLSFPYPYDNTQSPEPKSCGKVDRKVDQSQTESGNNKPTEPHYTMKYRSYIDLQDYRCSRDSAPDPRPKEIVITIDLPLLKSAEKANLNVTEKLIVLDSQRPFYRLELPLAYPVDEEKGEAKFNKLKKQLTVTLPVLTVKNPLMPETDNQQLVCDVACGESGRDDIDKITPSEVSARYQSPSLELSDLPDDYQLENSTAASSLSAEAQSVGPETNQSVISFEQSHNRYELTEGAIGGAKECLSHSSSEESGCHTDTSKPTDLHSKEALPSAAHTEAAAGCEENINEEEETDISHQSPNNVADENSLAASAVLTNLDCVVETGTSFHGAKDNNPCSELGPVASSAPWSVSAMGEEAHRSLPTDYEMAADDGKEKPSEIIQGLARAEMVPNGADDLTTVAKDGAMEVTGKLSGAVGKAEEEKAELDEDDLPFDSKPLPAVLRDINGEDGTEQVICAHSASLVLHFQNSLLYELD